MKASMELQQAMLKTNHSMTASMIPMLCQMPLFVSFFLTLRAMTSYPVDGMQTEGLFWFKDLTLSDPYYALPILTSSTLFVILKIGIEYGMSFPFNCSCGNADLVCELQVTVRRRQEWGRS